MFAMRRTINVRVSQPAADGWNLLAMNTGVTLSALVEAIGLWLASVDADPNLLPNTGIDIVQEARKIDSARRRRPR